MSLSAHRTTRSTGSSSSTSSSSLWTLVPYLRQHRRHGVLGVALVVLVSLVAAVPPLYVGAIVDSLSGRTAPMSPHGSTAGGLMQILVPFYRPGDLRTVMLCCGLLIAVVSVKNGCVYACRRVVPGCRARWNMPCGSICSHGSSCSTVISMCGTAPASSCHA